MTMKVEPAIVIAVVCCYIALISYCVLLVSIIYNYIGKPLRFNGICSIICIILFAISSATLAWMLQTMDAFTKWYIADVVYNIFWSFGSISIYILFIKRLQLTFDGTKYAISERICALLYLGCASFEIIFMACMICYYLKLENTLTHTQYDDIAGILIAAYQMIDFLLAVSVIIIFIKKLRKLSIEVGINDSNYDIQTNDPWLSRSQMKIVGRMSKITILSCVAILTTQSFLIYIGTLYWVGEPKMLNHIRYIYVTLDCIINSICVVLNFDFADEYYEKICFCESICTKLCAYKVKREFGEYRNRLLKEQCNLAILKSNI